MTDDRRLQVTPAAATMAVLVLLLAGAGATYLLMRGSRTGDRAHADASTTASTPPQGVAPPGPAPASAAPAESVVVSLTKAAVDRAGIRVTRVSAQPAADTLRVPGIVEPNAYRQVTVTPLVSGRVVRVSAQLGERVRRGQSMAEVYSPELAEARTKYVGARAMLDAHDRELQRTQKLVEIGAASREELERLHAEHAAQTAEVESAGARLQLLGVRPDDPSASGAQSGAAVNVPAPIDGVVTERGANAGSAVDPATKLFTIVDLANVWIVADVYERDLNRVRVGVRATITATAYPERTFDGRISFIDPQLNVATRTAKIRVEVANPGEVLRLGMYTDVVIESASATPVLAVPKEALQSVGDQQVVYLAAADDPARFVERQVRVGRSLGDQVEVLEGLSAGDSVVTTGSFFVRAEAERLGIRTRHVSPTATTAPAPGGATEVQTAKVAVTAKGFEPDKVTVRSGVPVRVTFVRTSDKTCATEVVFPSLNVRRTLPLNEPVVIEFTPASTGDVAFVCGVNMFRGAVVVQ